MNVSLPEKEEEVPGLLSSQQPDSQGSICDCEVLACVWCGGDCCACTCFQTKKPDVSNNYPVNFVCKNFWLKCGEPLCCICSDVQMLLATCNDESCWVEHWKRIANPD